MREGFIASRKRMKLPVAENKLLHPIMEEAWAQFLHVAFLVTKHNALIRARYPSTDAMYKKIERAFSGSFNDMPFQLVCFAGVLEDVAVLMKRVQDPCELSQQIANVIQTARGRAGSLKRDSSGKVVWKKSVSHVEATLIEDIERAAHALFASVYSLGNMPNVDPLHKHEREFWKRYETARRIYREARKDTEPFYFILMCLRTHLPQEICAETVKSL